MTDAVEKMTRDEVEALLDAAETYRKTVWSEAAHAKIGALNSAARKLRHADIVEIEREA